MVAGPSMSPTLLVGDRVVSSQSAYSLRIPFLEWTLFRTGDPDRGDVVVYHDAAKNATGVKRIVGLPGDEIELRANVLYVNGVEAEQLPIPLRAFRSVPMQNDLGRRVAEERMGRKRHRITYTPGESGRASFGPVRVPEGHCFLLGDNRDNSADSRYVGAVALGQLRGRLHVGGDAGD